MYFRVFPGKIERSLEVNDRFIVDLSKEGDILAIELLDVSPQQKRELEKNIKQGMHINITSSIPVTL